MHPTYLDPSTQVRLGSLSTVCLAVARQSRGPRFPDSVIDHLRPVPTHSDRTRRHVGAFTLVARNSKEEYSNYTFAGAICTECSFEIYRCGRSAHAQRNQSKLHIPIADPAERVAFRPPDNGHGHTPRPSKS